MITDFFARYGVTPHKALKVTGAVVGGVLVLLVLTRSGLFGAPLMNGYGPIGVKAMMGGMGGGGGGYGYDEYATYAEPAMMAMEPQSYGSAALSSRNIGVPPMPYQSPAGDAEAYEVVDYTAEIETRDAEEVCATVTGWKARTDVVFENSSIHDDGCSFRFKVKHKSVDEVLAALKALNPKYLSENSYTIKQQIDDYTGEEEVLKAKLAAIDETLKSAMAAYADITRLATRTEDAQALAQIIDSRVGVIERLSQSRIEVTSQLERLARAKSQELDRVDYTFFTVSVYKDTYLDPEALGDSWKEAVRSFVYEVNAALQELTIGLVSLLITILQYAIYLGIVLLAVKYGWQIGVRMWKA